MAPVQDGAPVKILDNAERGGVDTHAAALSGQTGHVSTLSEKIGAGGGSYTLSVKDLSYTIKQKTDKKEVVDRTLIHPVSFAVKPKSMLAIMGASGAGKSTMLDVLATRIPQSAVGGEYTMNDKPVGGSAFRRLSGYVMQDDALYPLLTVRETLTYAALLRIPNLSVKEKTQIVEETIVALRLTACADTIVGDDRHRGLSGGEKRRVSIGVDIVHQPSIIFLDEPTSGLDSTTALQIVETLHSICMRDRTVVMTIHQPSTRVFEVFNKVMFLSKGHMVYHDSPLRLSEHIQRVSREPLPQFANLPELFLEIVDKFEKENNVLALVTHRQELEKARQPSFQPEAKDAAIAAKSTYANGVLAESLILLHRNMRNVIRTPELFLLRVGLCVLMGLVLGSVFWNLQSDEAGMGKLAGYITFTEAFLYFNSLEALPLFLNEKGVFTREQGRGAYRIASYVLANTAVYLPFFLIMAVTFTSISFFMLVLQNTGGNFIYQIIVVFIVLVAANGFVTFLSGFAPDAITGNSAGTAILAFSFLFSGFFIPASAIAKGWIWMHYISMFKYPFEGLIKSNLDQRPASQDALRLQFEDAFNVEGVDRWRTVWVLLLFAIGWRVLFFAILRAKFTGKR